jgi:hypothetical protein
MRWTKLKSLIEDRFAPSVRARLTINSTRYGACTCGRAWLTLDGEEIANFCTRAYYNAELGRADPSEKTAPDALVRYGELSRQDAYECCWAFIHELSIEDALTNEDPLIQTLAVLDERVGKRRLVELDFEKFHPLARKLLRIRAEAEGLPLQADNQCGDTDRQPVVR